MSEEKTSYPCPICLPHEQSTCPSMPENQSSAPQCSKCGTSQDGLFTVGKFLLCGDCLSDSNYSDGEED